MTPQSQPRSRLQKARLLLSDPIPAIRSHEVGILGEPALRLKLFKLLIVERAEFRRQPPQGSDELQLADDNINDQPELCRFRKREATLDFALHLGERVTSREQI